MNGYLQFVNRLKEHLKGYQDIPQELWVKDALLFMNGLAEEELRRLVDLEKRREFGAFFTNSNLAYQLLSTPTLVFSKDCTVYDPAVGAGNLLIAAYKVIHAKVNKLTLLGTDLHSEFVHAAQLRLDITGLLADYSSLKPAVDLAVADGLQDNSYFARATHIVTNPPFNQMSSDARIQWGKGKVSAAAVFIDRIIQLTKPGTQIIAILPDVLRSGSRYEKWRKMVEETCTISDVVMLGQFDKFADVDVFSVILTTRKEHIKGFEPNKWVLQKKVNRVVGDLFEVSVGNVVDNRDINLGPNRPFLVSRGLAGWQILTQITRQRQFKGRAISSPFVVIKRTSRMGDKHRAVATIINVDEPIYVDNHLIVLVPRSGKIDDCEYLIKKLQLESTDEWINEQIRCRHLTVKIVARIPL